MYGYMFSQELQKQAVLVGQIPRVLSNIAKGEDYTGIVRRIARLKGSVPAKSNLFSAPAKVIDPNMELVREMMKKRFGGQYQNFEGRWVTQSPENRRMFASYLNRFHGDTGIRGSIIP
jgi:hypothetical protein